MPTPEIESWYKRLCGRFLVFEGPDGAGKSSQLSRFLEALTAAGVPFCQVREPGGTAVGEQIRAVLLDRNSVMSLHCEMLLYMASRAQLVEERIRPSLARGELVIADRFVSSTFAYQGTAGGVPADEIRAVADAALRGCTPDLVIVFDVDTQTAAKRTHGFDRADRGKPVPHATPSLFADRIELRGAEFHAKVRAGYLEQARCDPDHHLVIDGAKAPDEVWNEFQSKLRDWACASR